MADTLPPLVLELKAKSDQLQAELAKVKGEVTALSGHTATNSTAMSSMFSNISGSIGGMGTALLDVAKVAAAPLAALGAGLAIKSIVQDSIKQFEDLASTVKTVGRLSGGSAEQVSGMVGAMKLAGVNADDVTMSITMFEKHLGQAAGDADKTAALTEKLGVSFTNASGQIKPMAELLPGIADKFKSMPDGAEKTALATELFGRSGAQMIPVLNKGSAGIEELTAKAKDMGLVMDDASMKAFTKSKIEAREFGASIDGLKTTLGSELLPIVDSVQSIFRQALAPAIAGTTHFLQEHRESFTNVAVAIQGFADKVRPAVEGVFKGIGEAMKPISDAFKGLGDGADSMIPQILAITSAFSPFSLIMKSLQPILPELAKTIGELAGTLVTALGGALKDLLPVLADLAGTMAGLFATEVRALMPVIMDLVKVLGPILGELIKTLVPIIAGMAKVLGEGLGKVLADLAPLVGDLVKMLGEALGETIKVLAPIVMDLVKILGPIVGKGLEATSPLIGDLAKIIGDVFKAVMPLIPAVMDLIKAILPLLPPIFKLITDLLPPIIDLLVPIMKLFMDFGMGILKNIVIPIIMWLVDVLVGLVKGFIDTYKNVAKAMKDIGDFLHDAFTNIGKFVAELWNGMIDGIVKGWNAVASFFSGIGAKIGEFFSGAASWLVDVGQNIIRGLWDGLGNAWNWLTDRVRDLFGGLVDVVRDILGIHSPSRVFAEVGKNIGAGLHEGITGTMGAVKAAAGSLADGALEAFGNPQLNVNSAIGSNVALAGAKPVSAPNGTLSVAGGGQATNTPAPASTAASQTVNVYAQTNATPLQIASAAGWQLRMMG